ncbi:MAG TPA: TRAP transporter TatT component family protein [Anaeromyxobacteraceae bacterium]|nr:TRAP transporter TatT component family protein [Anaeromyxobacteraceae bacterium]
MLSLIAVLSFALTAEPKLPPEGGLAGAARPFSPPPELERLPSDRARYEFAMRAGNAAFFLRDDPEELSRAISSYRAALAVRPTDRIALISLARAQAHRAQAEPMGAQDAWREVSRAAETALREASPPFAEAVDGGKDPADAVGKVEMEGAEPLYWFALATMGMAQARGMAAVLAVKDVARAMMARAAELDERIDYGGPRRALGTLLCTIPSAAGGGVGAARAQLDRARTLAPTYQLTRVRDAEALSVLLQDRQRFESLLGEVLAFDETRAPSIVPENRLAKKMARDLLERADRLF